MKAIERLNNWFETERDYNLGVSIYSDLGYSMVLKRLFAKGPNKYNTNKLEAELKKILEKQSAQEVAIKKPATVKRAITKPTNSENQHTLPKNLNNLPVKRFSEPQVEGYVYEDLPDQLKYETQLRIRLYKEANAHHYRLETLEDPIAIKRSCQIILENFDKIQKLWARIDYYLQYDIVLPETEEKPKTDDINKMDPFELIKKRNNLRSNITKNRKKLHSLKDPNKINQVNQKIAHWEIEKAAIDDKIKDNE